MFGIPVWFMLGALAGFSIIGAYVMFVDLYTTHIHIPEEGAKFVECDRCEGPCDFDTCPGIN